MPSPSAESRTGRRLAGPVGRGLAFVSLAGASALIFGYLWWGRFHYFSEYLLAGVYAGTLAIILFGHWYFGDSRRELGLRLDNLMPALRLCLPLTLGGVLALLAAGFSWGTLRLEGGDTGATRAFLLYVPWALLQQYGLQNFLFLRFRTLYDRPFPALLSAAGLFALFHLPNFPLMALSLMGGLLWCWIFWRAPNLLAVTLSHVVLAFLALVLFKAGGSADFQVGRPGYRYEAFGGGVLVATGHDAAGRPFVATLPGHDRGAPSRLRIFWPDGTLVREWTAFEEYDFSGHLAAGDLGMEAGDEIATAPGPAPGNPPYVRVFSSSGRLLEEFPVAFEGGYGAGVSVADGSLLVWPGPAPGQAAQVLEYTGRGRLTRSWHFDPVGFVSGIRALGLGGERDSFFRLVLWGPPLAVNPGELLLYDDEGGGFFHWAAYPTTYGLNVARVQLAPGVAGLVTAPGPLRGYSAHVKVFDTQGGERYNFVAYESPGTCGSNVAAVDIDGDGRDEIVLGEGICGGSRPTVRIFNLEGILLHRWEAY